jgi:hypothetical protein
LDKQYVAGFGLRGGIDQKISAAVLPNQSMLPRRLKPPRAVALAGPAPTWRGQAEQPRSCGGLVITLRGGESGMDAATTKKVNETIIVLCDYIQKMMESSSADDKERLPSMIEALAKLKN